LPLAGTKPAPGVPPVTAAPLGRAFAVRANILRPNSAAQHCEPGAKRARGAAIQPAQAWARWHLPAQSRRAHPLRQTPSQPGRSTDSCGPTRRPGRDSRSQTEHSTARSRWKWRAAISRQAAASGACKRSWQGESGTSSRYSAATAEELYANFGDWRGFNALVSHRPAVGLSATLDAACSVSSIF